MSSALSLIRTLAIVLILAALPGMGQTQTAGVGITVSGPEPLANALASAKGGEVFLLKGGNYGTFGLNKWHSKQTKFPSMVTIRSADPANPARFSSFGLGDVENLTIEDVVFDYTYAPGHEIHYRPFQVNSSRNVTIRNSTFDGDVARGLSSEFDGTGFAYGLSVRSGRNIVIENNDMYDFQRGMIFDHTDSLVVRGNHLSSMSGDGMNFAQVRDVMIEGNRIGDFQRNEEAGIHPDMIQFWTAGTTEPSVNVTIRRNLLSSGTGPWSQSIFMRNELVDTKQAGAEMFYRNFAVYDNLIANAHLHGITMGEVRGLEIRNNTVVRNAISAGKQNNYDLWTPMIRVSAAAEQVRVANNITYRITGFDGQPGWRIENNILAQDLTRMKANHYSALFAGTDTAQPGSFAPRPGGPLDGTQIGAPVAALLAAQYGRAAQGAAPSARPREER